MYDEIVKALRDVEQNSGTINSYKTRLTAADTIETLAAQLVDVTADNARFRTVVADASGMHKHKVPGDRNSYSQFNEGWQDAVNYIVACSFDSLDADSISALLRRVEKAEAERDAAIADIPHDCSMCAHRTSDEVCAAGSKDNCFWQWRGVTKKEATDNVEGK